MHDHCGMDWESLVVSPEKVLSKIKPGMSIFLSTGAAEPRTMLKSLMNSKATNLQDLELIQIVSLGDAVSLEELDAQKYRLKTFFSGWVASKAIDSGQVDLIPSRFSKIPLWIDSGRINIDAAFIQITPPNEVGYCSLGVAVDAAFLAMEKADIVVGEINPHIPRTYGDTFVPISEFDYLVKSTEPPLYFNRWKVEDVFDKVAANVASVIDDGSCIAFSVGPLYDALAPHLSRKRNLGVHSPFFTDALMELVKSGAVTNRKKKSFLGKSITSYALGTPELMNWLDRNPMVEFQGLGKALDPVEASRNPKYIAILPARKVDLSGRIALHFGKGLVSGGPSEAMDIVTSAELSQGGKTIVALPSRNRAGEGNIRVSIEQFPNLFGIRESVDMVVTEYGVAALCGRTERERAQALIDIAHPEDRQGLVDRAKERKVLYADQIFLAESAHFYPQDVATKNTFKGGVELRFRAIKPSDEDQMRRLFYRFSDEAVYYRYFTAIKAMPHSRMQEYVNVDYRKTLSIVGLVGEPGHGKLIAEARYVKHDSSNYADIAFVVDEEYQGIGVASYLYKLLIQKAKERGIQGFTADVLTTNKSMMKVFEKGGYKVKATMDGGAYSLSIPFYSNREDAIDNY